MMTPGHWVEADWRDRRRDGEDWQERIAAGLYTGVRGPRGNEIDDAVAAAVATIEAVCCPVLGSDSGGSTR